MRPQEKLIGGPRLPGRMDWRGIARKGDFARDVTERRSTRVASALRNTMGATIGPVRNCALQLAGIRGGVCVAQARRDDSGKGLGATPNMKAHGAL